MQCNMLWLVSMLWRPFRHTVGLLNHGWRKVCLLGLKTVHLLLLLLRRRRRRRRRHCVSLANPWRLWQGLRVLQCSRPLHGSHSTRGWRRSSSWWSSLSLLNWLRVALGAVPSRTPWLGLWLGLLLLAW